MPQLDEPNNDENQYQRRQGDSVSIPTPFGVFKATGNSIIAIITTVAIIGGCVWFAKTHDDTTAALAKELREIKYILLLPQEKREKIADRLIMPESIRDALR